MSSVHRQLNYVRHFTLLLVMAVFLVLSSPWRAAPGPAAAFALYGALHASAVAVSLRARPPLGRQMLLIGMAALLSFATAILSLRAVPLVAALHGLAGPLAVVCAASFLGALAYGMLIRSLWVQELSIGALASTAAACVGAACAGFFAGIHLQRLGSLWLAIPWWLAFSGSLWYHDGRGDSP